MVRLGNYLRILTREVKVVLHYPNQESEEVLYRESRNYEDFLIADMDYNEENNEYHLYVYQKEDSVPFSEFECGDDITICCWGKDLDTITLSIAQQAKDLDVVYYNPPKGIIYVA